MSEDRKQHTRRRLLWHPFVRPRPDRIQERAYFHWLNRTGKAPDDPESNWLEAELEEVAEIVRHLFRVARDSEQPELDDVLFDEVYEPLVKIEYFDDVRAGKPRFFRPSEPRCCSLCGRSAPEASFRTRAHLIPELLGNREWLTSEECDGCNVEFGQSHENELGKMLLVDRALNHVPKKKGRTAKLKQPGKGSFLGGQARGTPLQIVLQEGDDSMSWKMVSDHEMLLEATSQPYRPLDALKSVARSVWHLLPRELQGSHGKLRQWIRGESNPLPHRVHVVFWPGPGRNFSGLAIWRLIDDGRPLPELVAMLHFGNVALIWPVPDFESKAPVSGLLPVLPISPYPPHAPTVRTMTIKGSGLARPKKGSITLHVSNAVLTFSAEPLPVVLRVAGPAGPTHEVRTLLHVDTDADENVCHKLAGDGLAGELELSLTPALDEGTARYALNLPDYSAPVALATCELLRALEDGGAEVSVIDSETGQRCISCNLQSGSNPDLQGLLDVTRQLVAVNEEFGLALQYPDSPDEIDLNQLHLLASAIEHGRIRLRPPEGKVSLLFQQKEQVVELLDLFDRGERSFMISGRALFQIGEHQIDPGAVAHGIEDADSVCRESLAALAEEDWEPEEMKSVPITCASVVEHYFRWISPDDEDGE